MSIVDKAINQAKSLASQVGTNLQKGVNLINRPSTEIKVEDLVENGERLQYPLHDVTTHQMYMTLNTLTQLSTDMNKAVKKLDKEQKTLTQRLIDAAPSRAENARNLFRNVNNPNVDLKQYIGQTKKPPVFGREVRLYIPASIQFADGMQYNTVGLGAIGGGAEAAIAAGQNMNLTEMGIKAAGEGAASLIDGLKASLDTDLGAVAAQRLARKAGQDTLAGAIASATQTTVNPNNRVLFDGVAVRTFSFQFTMIAESMQEAIICEEIIKHMRTEMYPSEILAIKGGVNIPVGYNFPKKWQIRFWDNATGNQVFHKIRPAYLTNMSTTYNSGEATFHEDGRPTSIEVTMTFTEDQPLSRKDITEGY